VIYPRSSWRGSVILRSSIKDICLILDQDHLQDSPENTLRAAHRGGVAFFQYRSKTGSRKSIYDTCLRLSRTAKGLGVLFLVNDHADIALGVEADGVHLGQDDLPIEHARKLLGPHKIIGISTHSLQEAVDAERSGADYIGFGSVFPTSTKNVPRVHGLSMLAGIKKAVSLPVIAIGGIKQETIKQVAHAGADGAAIITAILSVHAIEQASREMVAAWVMGHT